jgi:poly(3-hydroxybutyrate) depolymerase
LNPRKIVIGAVVFVIGLPVVLVLMAGLSFYVLMSFYALNRTNGSIISSGQKREYLLYVPPSYDRTRQTPLVISMHAAALWPATQREASHWNKVADENGFIVVYPSGTCLRVNIKVMGLGRVELPTSRSSGD